MIANSTPNCARTCSFLAAIGIYGVMSCFVTRRTNEIGIRMALGAPRVNVLWLVLSKSLLLVAFGIMIGLPLAFIANRLVSTILVGVHSYDPAGIGVGLVLLLLIAALACYLPAHRASRVDPTVALRYE